MWGCLAAFADGPSSVQSVAPRNGRVPREALAGPATPGLRAQGVAMLVQPGRHRGVGRRGGGETHRRLHLEVITLAWMGTAFEKARRGEVRIVHHGGEIAHRLRRDLRRVAPRHQLGGGEGGGQPGHFAIQQRQIGHPRLAAGEAFVIEKPRRTEQREQPRPCFVDIGHYADVTVGGRERLAVGIDLAEISGVADRRVEGQPAQMLGEHEAGETLEHRDFDALAASGAELVDDRRQHRIDAVQPGDLVGDQRREVPRARIAIDARQQRRGPGRGLDDIIIGLQPGVGTVLAEPDAVRIDDFGIVPDDRGVIEPEALRRIAADVEHEHIGVGQQVMHDGQIVRALQVEDDRSLAPVDRHEAGGHADRRRGPRRIAEGIAARGLDLDHLGPEIGEDLGRIGAEHHRRQIDDPDAREHRLLIIARNHRPPSGPSPAARRDACTIARSRRLEQSSPGAKDARRSIGTRSPRRAGHGVVRFGGARIGRPAVPRATAWRAPATQRDGAEHFSRLWH